MRTATWRQRVAESVTAIINTRRRVTPYIAEPQMIHTDHPYQVFWLVVDLPGTQEVQFHALEGFPAEFIPATSSANMSWKLSDPRAIPSILRHHFGSAYQALRSLEFKAISKDLQEAVNITLRDLPEEATQGTVLEALSAIRLATKVQVIRHPNGHKWQSQLNPIPTIRDLAAPEIWERVLDVIEQEVSEHQQHRGYNFL